MPEHESDSAEGKPSQRRWPRILAGVLALGLLVALLTAQIISLLTISDRLESIEDSFYTEAQTASEVADAQETRDTERTTYLEEIMATLKVIQENTAPSVFLRDFCTDPAQLNEMYDEMVYENTDNIHQQAHRQREFRAQVLTYCNR